MSLASRITSLAAAIRDKFNLQTTAIDGKLSSSHAGTGGTAHANFTSGAAGFVPASGGGTTNFLRADGTFAAPSGGGGSSDPLLLTSTDGTATSVDTVKLFRTALANRQMVSFVGPSGLDSTLQASLHGNSVFFFRAASGTTAPTPIGGTLTTAATMSMPTLATTNNWAATQRKRFQTSGTAGNLSGCRTAYTQWWRGNANGLGGFFGRIRFGQQINLNGAQTFIGLCGSSAALATTAGAVAALTNSFGVGYDTTDASTGNWFLYRNDASGTATKVDLGTGAARNATDGYELIFFCRPYNTTAGSIYAQVINLNTGATVLGTTEYTTDLPVNTTFLAFKAECNNGAVAAATNVELSSVYIESDF